MFYEKESAGTSYKKTFGMVGMLIFLLSTVVFGQMTTPTPTETAKPAATMPKSAQKTVLQPVMTDYKGIKIGMTADEVRDKLDAKPKVADKDGFYYVFSDDESAQITLDKNKKVRVISVTYSGKDAAPKYEDVFGKDISLAEKPSGRIYNLVRYPEAGYWVAYNRSAGNSPTTTVTMQKMRQTK